MNPFAPMAAWPQFILVKLIPLANGKTDKLPTAPWGQVGVDAHDAQFWLPYDAARALADAWGPQYTVGFVLTAADPFWCLDIDGCALPDGSGWSDLSRSLVAALPNTMGEVSQSGRGLHLWGQGPVPPHACKNTKLGLELYHEARFIALGTQQWGAMGESAAAIADVVAKLFPPREHSGEIPDDGPRADWCGPEDDDELIRRMMSASGSVAQQFGSRARFVDLWHADADALGRHFPSGTGGEFDRSSADMSLASALAFWTGCDVTRMERLMRRSALVRDKWDDRPEYLVDWTITEACAGCREVYNDKSRTVPALTAPAAPAAPATPGQAPQAPQTVTQHGLALTGVLPPSPDGFSGAGRLLCVQTNPPTSLALLAFALEEINLWVGLDKFTGLKMVKPEGATVPIPLDPVHVIRLRQYLELCGMKSVKSELMRDALESAAQANTYDSAMDWGHSLVWDGVPRIDGWCAQYLGAEDTPYTRAVGAYWWTGLAGRLLVPGLKADMAPILVGDQGKRKSTAIKLTAPNPDYFAELDLDKDEADLGRQMRGKLVCELPELRGMGRKDIRAMKAFIARAVDEWVPKFVEQSLRSPRRSLCFGTTNEDEFLNDPTGERRYLPFRCGVADLAAIERDRDQLWAEGIARFQANGLEWERAETLAREIHAEFTVQDQWQEAIEAHLEATPGPVRLVDIWVNVLQRFAAALTRVDELRIAAILKRLGRVNKPVRFGEKLAKAWVVPG